MSEASAPLLNDLLVELHRSLVQYVLEAWPWTEGSSEQVRGAVFTLGERQRQDAGELVKTLHALRYPIDFGMYPARFSRFHYVALDFLLNSLVEHQQALVQVFEKSVPLLPDGPLKFLGNQIARSQRDGLTALKLAANAVSAVDWMY